MYELIQAGERTYYIECPAKMGLFNINDEEVCLIDSGNDKDAAKKAPSWRGRCWSRRFSSAPVRPMSCRTNF